MTTDEMVYRTNGWPWLTDAHELRCKDCFKASRPSLWTPEFDWWPEEQRPHMKLTCPECSGSRRVYLEEPYGPQRGLRAEPDSDTLERMKRIRHEREMAGTP